MGNCGGIRDPPPNPDAVDLTHFELLKVVGKGGFGKVNAMCQRSSQELLALKRIEKYRVIKSKTHLNMLWTERKIMSIVTSPFLCHLRYAFESDTELFLVMPFLQGGDLRFHLKERGRMSESTARFYSAEMILGLQDLHSKNIVYRDLKPENVLLDEAGHLQITDFGLACFLTEEEKMRTRGQAGTRGYMAPETLSLSGYGLSVDYWSFGVVVYELLHGKRPWRNIDANMAMMGIEGESDPLAAARQDDGPSPQGDGRGDEGTAGPAMASLVDAEGGRGDEDEDDDGPQEVRFSRRLTSEAKSLLLSLLEFNPAKRLGARRGWAEVKSHPFFDKIDWAAMGTRSVKPPFQPDVSHANCTPDADLADQLLDKKPKRIGEEEQKVFIGWSWNTNIRRQTGDEKEQTGATTGLVTIEHTAAPEQSERGGPDSEEMPAPDRKEEQKKERSTETETEGETEVQTDEGERGTTREKKEKQKGRDREKERMDRTREEEQRRPASVSPVTPIAADDGERRKAEGGVPSVKPTPAANEVFLAPPGVPILEAVAASGSSSSLSSSSSSSSSTRPSLLSSGRQSTSREDQRKSISAGALSLHQKEETVGPSPLPLVLSPHQSSPMYSPTSNAAGTAEGRKERRSTMKEKRELKPITAGTGTGEHARTSSTPAVFPVA